ncbi:MAG: hypothetical protein QW179_00435 [Candidatus Hadarchaeales archaeon]
MEKRKAVLLTAVALPMSFVMIATGFLAFLMILLKIDQKLMASVVLWFYFIGTAMVFAISKPALKIFGFWKPLILFLGVLGGLAAASTIALLSF